MGGLVVVVLVPLVLIGAALALARIEKYVGGGARSASWRSGRGRPVGREDRTAPRGAHLDVADPPSSGATPHDGPLP